MVTPSPDAKPYVVTCANGYETARYATGDEAVDSKLWLDAHAPLNCGPHRIIYTPPQPKETTP